jgi:hypothetical protein
LDTKTRTYKKPSGNWCVNYSYWSAMQAGVKALEKSGNTWQTMKEYSDAGRLMNPKEYTPKAGDFVFFDFNVADTEDGGHTGIVVAYDEKTGVVYTIEGNTGDPKTVRLRQQSSSFDNPEWDPYNTGKSKHAAIVGYGMNGGTSTGAEYMYLLTGKEITKRQ